MFFLKVPQNCILIIRHLKRRCNPTGSHLLFCNAKIIHFEAKCKSPFLRRGDFCAKNVDKTKSSNKSVIILLLLYNKTLNKHVTALFCLYLGDVDTSANHFRNAPVGGHTCLTAGEQGEPADWGLQLCFSIGPRRRTHNNWIYNKLLNLSCCFPLSSLFGLILLVAVGPPTGTDTFIRL